MKRIAFAFALFAPLMTAQVQLARNVQVGSGGPSANFQHNSVPVTDQALVNWFDSPAGLSGGVLDPGFQPVAFKADAFGGWAAETAGLGAALQMPVTPPIGGQSVVLFPTACTPTIVGSSTGSCSNTGGGNIHYVYGGSGAQTDSLVWSGYTLPSYVVAANVTAVYAYAISSLVPEVTSNWGSGSINCTAQSANVESANYWSTRQSTVSTTLTGTTLATATCTGAVTGSVIGAKTNNLTIAQAGLIVYYTGTAPPASTAVNVNAPLVYNPNGPTLSITTPFDAVADTGAVNAYAIAVPGYGLTPGEELKFTVAHTNTTATPTLNLNGFGALTITGPTGLPLAAGDLSSSTGYVADVIYAANGKWLLQNPLAMQIASGTGPSQTVISSAATIAPTTRFFHVSGTTTITTITAPAFCVVAGTMCQITLIPDAIWATTTGGNIALGSTAVVSKALNMTYDPATTSWYPSY